MPDFQGFQQFYLFISVWNTIAHVQGSCNSKNLAVFPRIQGAVCV